MLGRSFEKGMRIAIFIAFISVVVIAPLIGVYAISPFVFVWWIQPYQLAVVLSVMLAEALGIAALIILVRRSRK